MKESIMIILFYYNTTLFRLFPWLPFSLDCFGWNHGGGEGCGGCWNMKVVWGYKPSWGEVGLRSGQGGSASFMQM